MPEVPYLIGFYVINGLGIEYGKNYYLNTEICIFAGWEQTIISFILQLMPWSLCFRKTDPVNWSTLPQS